MARDLRVGESENVEDIPDRSQEMDSHVHGAAHSLVDGAGVEIHSTGDSEMNGREMIKREYLTRRRAEDAGSLISP